MGALVQTIIQAICKFLETIFLALTDVLASAAEQFLNMDLSVMTDKVPILNVVYNQLIPAVALALLILVLTFAFLKPLTSFDPVATVDNPLIVLIKTLFFGVGIFFSRTICNEILWVFRRIKNEMEVILNYSGLLGNGSFVPDSLYNDPIGWFTSNMGLASVGVLFISIILLISMYSLTLEVGQRYVTFVLTIFFGPLAFACGPSKSTNDITRNWFKFFIGNGITLTITAFLYKCMISLVKSSYDAVTSFEYFIVWVVLTLAIPSVAKKIDTYLNQLGLIAPRTDAGGALVTYTALSTMRSIASSISHMRISKPSSGTPPLPNSTETAGGSPAPSLASGNTSPMFSLGGGSGFQSGTGNSGFQSGTGNSGHNNASPLNSPSGGESKRNMSSSGSTKRPPSSARRN